jgi:hypothetical protein
MRRLPLNWVEQRKRLGFASPALTAIEALFIKPTLLHVRISELVSLISHEMSLFVPRPLGQ